MNYANLNGMGGKLKNSLTCTWRRVTDEDLKRVLGASTHSFNTRCAHKTDNKGYDMKIIELVNII